MLEATCPLYIREYYYKTTNSIPEIKKTKLTGKKNYVIGGNEALILEISPRELSDTPMMTVQKFSGLSGALGETKRTAPVYLTTIHYPASTQYPSGRNETLYVVWMHYTYGYNSKMTALPTDAGLTQMQNNLRPNAKVIDALLQSNELSTDEKTKLLGGGIVFEQAIGVITIDETNQLSMSVQPPGTIKYDVVVARGGIEKTVLTTYYLPVATSTADTQAAVQGTQSVTILADGKPIAVKQLQETEHTKTQEKSGATVVTPEYSFTEMTYKTPTGEYSFSTTPPASSPITILQPKESPTAFCTPTIESLPELKNTAQFKWVVYKPPEAPVFKNLNTVIKNISDGKYNIQVLSRTNKVLTQGLKSLTTSLPKLPEFAAMPDLISAMKMIVGDPLPAMKYLDDTNIRDGSYRMPPRKGNGYEYPIFYKSTIDGQYKMYEVELDVANPDYGKYTISNTSQTIQSVDIAGKATSRAILYPKVTQNISVPKTIKKRMPVFFVLWQTLPAVTDVSNLVNEFTNNVNDILSNQNKWDFQWKEVAHSGAKYGGIDPNFFIALAKSIDTAMMYPRDMARDWADITKAPENWKRMVESVNATQTILDKMGRGVTANLTKSIANLQQTGLAFIGLSQQMPEKVMAVVSQFGSLLSNTILGYVDNIKQQAAKLGQYGTDIANALQAKAEELRNNIQSFMNSLVPAMQSDMDEMSKFFTKIITDLSNAVVTDMKDISSYMTALVAGITDNAQSNASTLNVAMQKDIYTSLAWMQKQVGNFGTCMMNNVMFVKVLAENAVKDFQAKLDTAVTNIKAEITKYQNEVMTQMDKVKATLSEIDNLSKILRANIDKQTVVLQENREKIDKLVKEFQSYTKDTDKKISDLQSQISGGMKKPSGFWPFSGGISLGMCQIEEI
jgi:hypothetical protein